jgi:hypothetical protein
MSDRIQTVSLFSARTNNNSLLEVSLQDVASKYVKLHVSLRKDAAIATMMFDLCSNE